jgi:hypothetical protein
MNYRRKDYFFPRSIREAFGRDETYEPEIRCVSESWGIQRTHNQLLPTGLILAVLAATVWFVVKN